MEKTSEAFFTVNFNYHFVCSQCQIEGSKNYRKLHFKRVDLVVIVGKRDPVLTQLGPRVFVIKINRSTFTIQTIYIFKM